MKKTNLLGVVVAAALLCESAFGATTNWYGNPTCPDAYGNTTLGTIWLPNSTTVSNTLLGISAGYNITAGTNLILIGNQGTAGDNNLTRIGAPGTQTSCAIAGTVTTTSNFITFGANSTNFLQSGGNVLAYSNTVNIVSSAVLSPGPVIVLQTYTNSYSPSNIIQTVTGEADWSGNTAGTLLISNAWPWTENAGTNQTVSFYGYAMGNSQDGTKNWYTVTNIAFTVTNNGANYGPLLQNQAMFAGISPPTTPAFVAGSAGWSYGLTPGSTTPQHVIWYGTLISKY